MSYLVTLYKEMPEWHSNSVVVIPYNLTLICHAMVANCLCIPTFSSSSLNSLIQDAAPYPRWILNISEKIFLETSKCFHFFTTLVMQNCKILALVIYPATDFRVSKLWPNWFFYLINTNKHKYSGIDFSLNLI